MAVPCPRLPDVAISNDRTELISARDGVHMRITIPLAEGTGFIFTPSRRRILAEHAR